jgi:hypothetical protein
LQLSSHLTTGDVRRIHRVGRKDDQFVAEATAAFQVPVEVLIEQQNAGDIRRDDPVLMHASCGRSCMALPCWSLMDSCPRQLK